jgi:hypothetical protein
MEWRGEMASKVRTPPNPKMVNDLQAAAVLLGTSVVASMTKGKTYEAWIMFEVALEVASNPLADPTPVTVKACQHDRQTATTFNMRGGPGHIQPDAPHLPGGACHFEFSRNGKSLELHASVEHIGASGSEHELDLSVMPTAWVDVFRTHGGGPYDGWRHLGLELKAYDGAATLGKNLARALVAVAGDLDPAIALPRFTRAAPAAVAHLPMHRFHHPQYWLITTADISDPTKAYLDWYNVEHAEQVDVPSPGPPAPVQRISAYICRHL